MNTMNLSSLAFTLVLAAAFSGKAFAWQPEGQTEPGFTAACHPQLWARRYLSLKNADARAESLQRFLADCAPQARAGLPSGIEAEDKFAAIQDIHRGWEWTEFLDRTSRPLSGWLLMQERSEGPRPLVVIGCDFNCAPDSNPWLKTLAMSLYDEGRMSLFVVNSPEALREDLWLAGGVQYGRDLLEAGFWIQLISPYRGRFSSAHVLGLGWSAHAGLIAQFYNDKNPIADDRKVFHSAVNFCPAVDVGSVLSALDAGANIQTQNFGALVRRRLSELKRDYLPWRQWLQGWDADQDLKAPWVHASVAQTGTSGFHWLSPFRAQPPRSNEAWLETSNLSYQLGTTTPGWVLGANHDPLYPASEHWEPLERQHSDPRKSNLKVFGIDADTTCALPGSHDWTFTSHLIRTLIQQEAYEIWPREAFSPTLWKLKTPVLNAGELHLDQHWRKSERGEVTLTYLIGRGDLADANVIYREVTVTVPDESLPTGLNLSLNPRSATRQLNAWLRLKGESGPLVQSAQDAKFLELMK
jgi:hypothetical protein